MVIGEKGQVKANLRARNVLVAGLVKGNISALGKVEVASTGKIYGDLQVASLVIDDGAVFQGSCQMRSEEKNTGKNQVLELDKKISG